MEISNIKIGDEFYPIKDEVARNELSKLNSLKDNIKIAFPQFNNNSLNETTNGDCSIIKSKNKLFMIDTFYKLENFNGIKKAMTDLESNSIDYLLLTHYDEDHWGNLERILQTYDCSNCLFLLPRIPNNSNLHDVVFAKYTQVIQILQNYNITNYRFANNETIEFDGIKINIFNASQEDLSYYDNISTSTDDYNNYSICCEVLNGLKSALFTGDIDTTAQLYITKNYLSHSYDILKVPHHGYTHLNNAFIELVAPKIAIIETTKGFWNNLQYNESSYASYLSTIGSNVYLIGYQNVTTIFNMNYNSIALASKSFACFGLTNTNILEDIYVDAQNSNDLRLGTIDNPFFSLKEALSLLNQNAKGYYNIHIKNLNDTNDIVNIYNLHGIRIYAENNNLNPLNFERCSNIILYNPKFNHNFENNEQFELKFKQCKNIEIYDISSTSVSTNFMRAELSDIYFGNNIEIKNKSISLFALFYSKFILNATPSIDIKNNCVAFYGNSNNIIVNNEFITILKNLNDFTKIMPLNNLNRNIYSENWKNLYILFSGNVTFNNISIPIDKTNFNFLEIYTRDLDGRCQVYKIPSTETTFNLFNLGAISGASGVNFKMATATWSNNKNLNLSNQSAITLGNSPKYQSRDSIGIYKIIGIF